MSPFVRRLLAAVGWRTSSLSPAGLPDSRHSNQQPPGYHSFGQPRVESGPLFWLRDAAYLIGSIVLCIGLAVSIGVVVAKGGMAVASMLMVLPPVLAWLISVFNKPVIALKTYYHVSFIVLGSTRFISVNFPIGLSVDFILLLALISASLNASKKQWAKVPSPVFYSVLVWLLYTVLEIANPEMRNRGDWFFGVRGLSLYWIQAIVVGVVILNQRSDVKTFINIWLTWSFLAALWAFKQQYIGLTPNEQLWLDLYGKGTHLLFGNLRSWSFYSDAGQFGAAMAHVALFCLIRTLDAETFRERLKYAFLLVIYFWGFAVSGSRGPLFVLVSGFVFYLLLRKNITIIMVGAVLGGGAYGLLKYTMIGQSNYQVQRMRSAFDPNDPSLLLRLENQKKLSRYLATRPLGAGIGGAGVVETAMDSWYVKVWVETGIIGLYLHIITLVIIAGFCFWIVWKMKDPRLRSTMSGLYCGMVGIMFASYGNQIFAQLPTSTVLYMSMVFLTIAPMLDQQAVAEAAAENRQ